MLEIDEFLLPPDAALAREMYAHFGLAVYLAQVFEKGLQNLITGVLWHENDGKWSQEQYDIEVEKIERQTLGPLLKRAKQAVDFDPESLSAMEEAYRKRNFLIHDYFMDNAQKSVWAEGKRQIIEELKVYQEAFRRADTHADIVTNALWRATGMTEEHLSNVRKEIERDALEAIKYGRASRQSSNS